MSTRRKAASTSIMLVSLFGAACGDSTPTPTDVRPGEQPGTATASTQRPRSIDAEFLYLAGVVPGGFGGLYFEDGRPIVRLKDLRQQDAAAAVIVPYLRERYPRLSYRLNRVGEIGFVQAEHDFATLARWRTQVEAIAVRIPEIVLTDADERRNRVVVGVATAAAIPLAMSVIGGLRLPDGAVLVEQRARQTPTATLDDRATAVAGGYRLQWDRGACTFGFNAYTEHVTLGRIPVFVTNAHCSRQRFRTDSHEYFQYEIGNPTHKIGYELNDPPTFTGGDCPGGYSCRYADALLGHWQTPRMDLGRIARTTGYGSKVISADPSFKILKSVPFPYEGEELQRVGMVTGWQKGVVSETCFSSYPPVPGTMLLCQDNVAWPTTIEGDSGAPIFALTPDIPGWVFLVGVNWGAGGMSAMMNIESDLGPLQVARCDAEHPYYPDCQV